MFLRCRTKLGFEHIKAPNGEASPVGYQPTKTCFVRLDTHLTRGATIADLATTGRNSAAAFIGGLGVTPAR